MYNFIRQYRLKKNIDNYCGWLKNNISIKKCSCNDWTAYTFPFLTKYNEHIKIYVNDKCENNILLTDDGKTLNDISLILNIADIIKLINPILLQHGLILESINNELQANCTRKNLSEKIHNFISAILEISNIVDIKKNIVSQ